MSVAAYGQRVVGFDVGGTKIRAGITDHDGNIRVVRQCPTARGGTGLVEDLADLTTELCDVADVSITELGGIGIALAGVPRSGTLDRAPNLGEITDVPIDSDLARRFGCPVIMENDVNAAAVGELRADIGTSARSFAFIAVGTGIGMGLILDGNLYRGTVGAAGEIGYLPFGADPFDQVSHAAGALERVVSGEAIAQRARSAADDTSVTASTIFERAAAGDPASTNSLGVEAKWLALAIACTEAIADVGHYVLGGGIGSRPELVDLIKPWLTKLGRDDIALEISRLGVDAAVIGAAALAAATATSEPGGTRA